MVEGERVPFRVGETVANKYRIERILGVGGMGVVVAARHLQLEELVALKFLRPEMVVVPEAVSRFAREARAAVRLRSDYVARVFDVGSLDSGLPYMVMEYLEGEDLSRALHERGPLPVEQAVEFVLQACEALAEAHTLGIVHRDLKPSNLFCVRHHDGTLRVKLLDFGISKMVAPSGSAPQRVSTTTSVLGSPLYLSPEQVRASRDMDHRVDLWGLGAILYELLAGTVPFQGQTVPEIAVKIATAQPMPIGTFRSDVPAALESIVLRCLEKDRTLRYANVGDLARDLARFAPARALPSVDRIAGILQQFAGKDGGARPPAVPERGSASVAPWGATVPPKGNARRRWILTGAALGVLLLAGAGAAIRMGHRALAPADGQGAPGASGAVSPSPPSAVASAEEVEPPKRLDPTVMDHDGGGTAPGTTSALSAEPAPASSDFGAAAGSGAGTLPALSAGARGGVIDRRVDRMAVPGSTTNGGKRSDRANQGPRNVYDDRK